MKFLQQCDGRLIRAEDPVHQLQLHVEWSGDVCRSNLENCGQTPVRVKDIVLISGTWPLPLTCPLYAESYQMLSQTGGTLAQPLDLTELTDRGHYRLPTPPGAVTVYNLLRLEPEGEPAWTLGFTSCRRFQNEIRLFPDGRFEIAIDPEGLEIKPGERWELEEMIAFAGENRSAALARVARQINQNHPRLPWAEPPTGWCSWYCFYEKVTEQDILRNLDAVIQRVPALRYIQIDDGYQAAMGDWLVPGPFFKNGLQPLIRRIRDRGLEPAIWVAPFIAEAKSQLLREHPDWFIKDHTGKPLASNEITFGGWRCAPWYMLDGTHPGAQGYLEHVFRVMKENWGCTYFKLDANCWGAMPGGIHHDRQATRVESYRRGMEAIRRGAGDAFILGCNAPMWPSLGLVHGMRTSNDIMRTWTFIRGTARENLLRSWQNGKLWWNDPDCLVLADLGDQRSSAEEYTFHEATILASGGMVLAGDDLSTLPEAQMKRLRHLVPPLGKTASFASSQLDSGIIKWGENRILCLFNWTDHEKEVAAEIPGCWTIEDYWTGEPCGGTNKSRVVEKIPPHGARIRLFRPA